MNIYSSVLAYKKSNTWLKRIRQWVTYKTDNKDIIDNWKSSGIYSGSGIDGANISGIMPFDEFKNNIKGDYTKGSINYEYSEAIYEAANNLNEQYYWF